VPLATAGCGGAQDGGMHGGDTPVHSATPGMTSGMPGMNDEMPAGDGLAPTVAGLTLRLIDQRPPAGRPTTLRFQITGNDGRPVTTFAPDQTKLMHFYLIRSDLTGFQHLHPEMSTDGTWTTAVAALQPGTWRAYASFNAIDGAGKSTTAVLGEQVTVPGTATAVPLPAPAASAEVDGYTLTVTGQPMANMRHELTVNVTKGGRPVTDLQPYLSTYAHLTAFHEGDLAFAHLHPHGTAAGDHGGPTLTFEAMLPRPGRWRLYLRFQTAGTLHTGSLVLAVG
jgi:hypothetical protein